MNTLVVALAGQGRRVGQDGLAITVGDCTPGQLWRLVCSLAAAPRPDPVWLAGTVRAKVHEKYDRHLSAELLDLAYAGRALDVPGAWACLADIGAPAAPADGLVQ